MFLFYGRKKDGNFYYYLLFIKKSRWTHFSKRNTSHHCSKWSRKCQPICINNYQLKYHAPKAHCCSQRRGPCLSKPCGMKFGKTVIIANHLCPDGFKNDHTGSWPEVRAPTGANSPSIPLTVEGSSSVWINEKRNFVNRNSALKTECLLKLVSVNSKAAEKTSDWYPGSLKFTPHLLYFLRLKTWSFHGVRSGPQIQRYNMFSLLLTISWEHKLIFLN